MPSCASKGSGISWPLSTARACPPRAETPTRADALNRLSFTEFAAGRCFTSHRRTLTETDHQLFMMLIGDWSQIHADAEYARLHGPGQRIVHGGLGVALTLGLQTSALEFADPLLAA